MPADDSFRTLSGKEALDEAFARSEQEPVLLFKHSNRCPISAGADDELSELDQEADPPVYRAVVQKAGPVADEIEERTDLRHETPQAILLYHREPIFNASHRNVTATAVRQAAEGVRA